MKKTALISAALMASGITFAESPISQFNTLGYGTLSGRLQTLSIYRDYDNDNNNHATGLGLQLNYSSPTNEGWSVGASYIGVGVLDSMHNEANPGERLLANGRVNVLNELYLSYNLTALGLTNSTAKIGRQVSNGEVFRADEYRQKKRAIEAITFESTDFHNTSILVGHAWEMSNWPQTGNLWDFRNFDNWNTDGITWAEIVNNCIDGIELALYDAYAQDRANLIGTRIKVDLTESTSILGYFRTEKDVGEANGHDACMVGLSLAQKIHGVKLEGGYLGTGGDDLFFQELTTGINHALGASMMLYSGQFNGSSDTVYLKATTKLEESQTTLYGLWNYTWHEHDKTAFDGQELNVVIKQPIPTFDNLTVAFKGGMGARNWKNGTADTIATDARLFVTYTF